MTRQPQLAVLAVVLRGDHVLLVRRRNEPDAGLWGFPGGKVDLGETILDAAERELTEETGLTAVGMNLIDTLEVIRRADDGGIAFHYVMAAVLCGYRGGDPVAADDAEEAAWHSIQLVMAGGIETSVDVDRVLVKAMAQNDD